MKDCICHTTPGPLGFDRASEGHDVARCSLHLTTVNLAGADPTEFGSESPPGGKAGRFNHVAERH